MLFGLGSSGLVGIAALGLSFSMAACAANEADTVSALVDVSRQRELVRLVRQDCGSCHGLTLKGGLGPALLPDALNGKPVEYLALVILQGRANTAMPPWKRFLKEEEAQWIAVNLKKGFPDGH